MNQNDIKIIAHRGWSSGKYENTLNAFKKAVIKKVDGVEFDVRWSKNGDKIIVSHNPELLESNILYFELEEILNFLEDKNMEILLEMKECDDILFKKVINLVNKFKLEQKTLIFGFRKIAEKFLWNEREKVKLGTIIEYPWQIKKNINKFNPDFVLIGWDYRYWTKFVFKWLWSVFSLPKLFKKYNNINFVIGIVTSEKDYNWLNKQKGLYALTADNPLEWK